jgi:hypothetical protein
MCLCFATLIGILAIFMGALPDFVYKILLNLAIIGGCSIANLKPAQLCDRGQYVWLCLGGFIVSFLGVIYLSLLIWSIISIETAYSLKWMASLITVIFGLNLMYIILGTDIQNKKLLIAQVFTCIFTSILISLIILIIWMPSIGGDTYIKLVSVCTLLIGFGSTTVGILRKMYKQKSIENENSIILN